MIVADGCERKLHLSAFLPISGSSPGMGYSEDLDPLANHTIYQAERESSEHVSAGILLEFRPPLGRFCDLFHSVHECSGECPGGDQTPFRIPLSRRFRFFRGLRMKLNGRFDRMLPAVTVLSPLPMERRSPLPIRVPPPVVQSPRSMPPPALRQARLQGFQLRGRPMSPCPVRRDRALVYITRWLMTTGKFIF